MSPKKPAFVFESRRYPTGPGCYLMADRAGRVLYVGKAINLRRRLSSYFRAGRRERRTASLVARVASVEVILVDNEVESLVLENNLIKRHQPPYNRLLKSQDSGYFYIVLTAEEFPRLIPFRKKRFQQETLGPIIGRCFGPYPNRDYRDRLLQVVADAFQLRTCETLPARACLRYHMHRCAGLCEARISPQAYVDSAQQAAAFLERPQPERIEQVRAEMMACAERLEFERAQRLKERLQALEQMLVRQVVERQVGHDEEVLFFGPDAVLVATVQHGALQGLDLVPLQSRPGQNGAHASFVLARYAHRAPDEIICNELPEAQLVEQALARATGRPVKITVPHNGAQAGLLALCEQNYVYRTSR